MFSIGTSHWMQTEKHLNRQWPFEVTCQSVCIHTLPPVFNGFTVVHLSDLHIDEWNIPTLEAAIDVVNRLQSDLIVCTGDFIASGNRYLPEVSFLLKQFQAKYGKIACLGNHDYADGHQGEGVRKALTQAGFEVLVNQATQLNLHYHSLQIAGCDDLLEGKQCVEATTRSLDTDRPFLLLSHNPGNFEAMAEFSPDLILSGHTHGGQIRLPKAIHQWMLGFPYIAGHYQHHQSQLYVNRGLGVSILDHQVGPWKVALPTPRWNVKAEIGCFTLTPAADSSIVAFPSRHAPSTAFAQ